MNTIERFLQNNSLQNPDDIDSLLELSEFVRQLLDKKRYADIDHIINHLVSHAYHDALSWCMDVLQEALSEDLEISIGTSIPDYDEFVERLQIDFNVFATSCETVCGDNGEVESFYNISMYKTRYENIYLISSENFDNKDNDFIQYKLVFTANKKDL